MSENHGVSAARGAGPAAHHLPPRLSMPEASADPRQLAWQMLQVIAPGFADAGCVLVLEELLSGGAVTGQAGGARQGRLVARWLASEAILDGHLVAESAFPRGEVVAFGPDSPCYRCVHDAAPVIFTQASRSALSWITPAAEAVIKRYTSFLVAPMIARGTTVGVLVLGRSPGAPAFGDADARAAADLAVRAAHALAGSLALMRHQSVAEALRPARPAAREQAPGGLEIAGRCLPAAGCDIGGDWYDIIPLPRGRTGLVTGDVMGHGPAAATVMSRLSAAAYTLADLDLPPAEVLRQLNRTALALPQETLVTCAYAVIDPAAHACDLATAGHLPPVLAMPDGTVRVPGIPGGQSLGVGPASYGQARAKLPPGTILSLYTDGLVETRRRSFDQGIQALGSVLARHHADLGAACEEVITSVGQGHEDDITLVLARIVN